MPEMTETLTTKPEAEESPAQENEDSGTDSDGDSIPELEVWLCIMLLVQLGWECMLQLFCLCIGIMLLHLMLPPPHASFLYLFAFFGRSAWPSDLF